MQERAHEGYGAAAAHIGGGGGQISYSPFFSCGRAGGVLCSVNLFMLKRCFVFVYFGCWFGGIV